VAASNRQLAEWCDSQNCVILAVSGSSETAKSQSFFLVWFGYLPVFADRDSALVRRFGRPTINENEYRHRHRRSSCFAWEISLARRTRIHSRKRNRQLEKRRALPGTPPGSILVDPLAPPTEIRVIAWNEKQCHEQLISSISEVIDLKARYNTVWVDVIGLGSADRLQLLASTLKLHALAMEDVINVHQRAKVDSYDEDLFVVARMPDPDPNHESEQLAFFLLDNILVSFQERPGDCWNPIRQRLREQRGRVFESKADYLLYALLDSVIDTYFPAMEEISEIVEQLDEQIASRRSAQQLHDVHQLRQRLLGMRRLIRPHRELFNELLRDGSKRVHPETLIHLRDTYDHVTQLIDSIDTYRELTSDLRDFYLSSVNNNMNEVMKVLTIISTIFIPMSFIAGVYGMNFADNSPLNMPELKWHWGYPFAWALMIGVATVLLGFLRWRKWL
jgi:magnesium transporter